MAAQSPPLAGRVAIVTGSSRGIGRAIAIHLAELGARVVVNYTTKSSDAELVAAEINGLPAVTGNGPRAIVVQANVSEPSQVKSLFDAAERAFESPVHILSDAELVAAEINGLPAVTGNGPSAIVVQANVSEPSQVTSLFDAAESAFELPVHILVNSAGVLDPKYPSIANTSVEDFDRTFSVNTKGAFLCSKEAANRLKQGGGGRIILLTSSMTRGLKPGFGAYAASKAAVETMVKILAKELKGTGITANCVAPGPIATEMFYEGKSSEVKSLFDAAERAFESPVHILVNSAGVRVNLNV
ncbi:hypothetical protein DY000_02043940 [Brassica cretica]|uniref:Ketoreductase domain-containing protein n=1 Tax=Brassica cretica TaxID=69181 RepID=A0ABQ7BJC9_BRACR|nr:hypothetical protein DY000_02043940 [Brassica cretica]